MSEPMPRYPIAKLPLTEWPAVDRAAWDKACNPRPGPFRQGRLRSPFTDRKYANGYAFYLGHLKHLNLLNDAETPAQRVTLERLGGYFERLKAHGNADYTILGRFEELRGALQLMDPGRDFTFITRPQNVSIRQMLPMSRVVRFVPDARHAVLWAEDLFREALSLSNPEQRQRQVRDAALIGILASRGPRLRAVAGMRLGRHLIRTDEGWALVFDRALMKGGRSELHLPNDPRVSAILDRYIAVERQELLRGQMHDAVWVNIHGGPLSYEGIGTMMKSRTRTQFGIAFGPHRFRTSLVTTAAVVDGTTPLGPALVLAHTPRVALKHYNRATNLEATRRHDARIKEAEDAAEHMLGRAQRNTGRPDTLPSLLEIQRRRKRSHKPSSQLDLFT